MFDLINFIVEKFLFYWVVGLHFFEFENEILFSFRNVLTFITGIVIETKVQ